MRRISLSLALLGAVTAAGCGGGASSGKAGDARGVAEGTFTVTIQNGQNGNTSLAITSGYVTSTPAGIDCGVAPHNSCSFDFASKNADGTPAAVTLTATAVGTGRLFLGWAGDCSSVTNVCTVSGAADQYVVARFGAEAERMGHPNWSNAIVHRDAARQILGTTPGTFLCANCHGADLKGQGLAPGCLAAGCHASAAQVHATLGAMTTMANGPAATRVCITCHSTQAAALMATQHWTWRGPTPQLFDVDAAFALSATRKNPGTIGKANLVNNFCVSVAANERRCDQCHAGYGDAAANLSARTPTLVNDPSRVDCLICHSSSVDGRMLGATSPAPNNVPRYNKIAGAFGAAGNAVGPGAPAATAAQLATWASTVQLPTRENCGWCHFNGGGADSVKIMSTALRLPAAAVDVHMSPDAASGGQDMSCADCHADGHEVKGAGVHTPTNTARLACADCHGAAPHASATLNGHLDAIACQTCHIPAYGRGMPQKTDWDWSTAGWKTAAFPHPATIYACVNGTVEAAYDNNNCATAGGVRVKKYDYMKGTFAWGQNVRPSYRWYNGAMTHVTTDDKGAFTIETGLTPALADRITLSAPLGARGNGKIFPFKVMTGRQAVYVDDAAASSFIITPNLFAETGTDGGFWGVLSAQPPGTTHGYAYLGAVNRDAFGAPDAPLAGNFVLNQTTAFTGTSYGGYTVNPAGDTTVQYSIETLLAAAFTKGAIAAEQVPTGTASFARYAGAGTTGWDWRYTKMFLDLEHEVAPAAQAIGAGGNCAACHSATPVIPICELYAGVPATELPWGVTCP